MRQKMHHMTASAYKKQATLSKVLCLHKKRPASTTLWQSVYFNIKKVHSIFANFLLLQIKKKKQRKPILMGNHKTSNVQYP